jgi:hypothetical protein
MITTMKPCGRWAKPGESMCPAHAGTDPQRRCAARVESSGYKGRCCAWPLLGLPFCRAHDPQERELRRLERESAKVKVDAVRVLLGRVQPEIRARALELLVMGKRITLEDVRQALQPYLDRQLAIITISDDEADEPDGR